MPLTDSPLLALLLISSTLSTPIISFPDLLMSKSDRIDNCRSKAAVGAGLTISENFRLPEWKAAFTIFVNQTLPNTAADRGRKNDRRDAEWLARLLACRNVVEVWVVNVNPSFTDSTNAIAPIAPTHPRRFRRRQAPFPASRSGARSFVR